MICPSADILEKMLDEQLADAEQAAISLHITACADCQGAWRD